MPVITSDHGAEPLRCSGGCTFPNSIWCVQVFVYPLFSDVTERAEVHFCPDVYNDDHLNVSALLSKPP